jgi:hypothetical protein
MGHDFQQDLLGGVLGILGISQHAHGHIINPTLMTAE